MAEDENKLEAKLVRRSVPPDERGHVPWVRVVGFEKSEAGAPYVRILRDVSVTSSTEILFLPMHYILGIRSGNMMEDFSTADETQNEAWQLIEQFVADEEGFQVLESERKTDVTEKRLGPRRIEVLIQEKRVVTSVPAKRKRLVVTGLLEPSGRFPGHILAGREWRNVELRDLAFTVTSFNSELVDIMELFIYDGGSIFKEENEPFGTETKKQETAWRRAVREFGRIEPAQRGLLVNWDGKTGMPPAAASPGAKSIYPDVEPDDYYGYGHSWINRPPPTYKPSPPHRAYFRVAGDAIGNELLQKHHQKLLETRMEIIVVPDPVPVAPDPPVEAKVSKPHLPIIFKEDDSFHQCYCGMPGCENCHLTAILAESGGRMQNGRYTIH